MESAGGIVSALVLLSLFVLVWIGLFLLLRKVALWYWRVNEIVDSLAELRAIRRELKQIRLGSKEDPPSTAEESDWYARRKAWR